MYSSTLIADESALLAKYSTPMPPSANALLEIVGDGSPIPFSPQANRNSLLLDTSDDIGMRLLLSNASIDSQYYKILSLEEVERLKREKTLLDSRVEAHTRKLALESKVRDASQNLVRLHASRNKRMSKQAEEQLDHATRKVEDLATDLWRLQRRQAIIDHQLLEHTAGILARSVNETDFAKRSETFPDFGETDLYRDSNLSYRDSASSRRSSSNLPSQISSSSTVPNLESSDTKATDATTKAGERLVDANDQLLQYLRMHTNRDLSTLVDVGNHSGRTPNLEYSISTLEHTLLTLQECFLEQKRQNLLSQEIHESFASRLYVSLHGKGFQGDSATSIEDAILKKVQEFGAWQKNAAEVSARANDLEKEHASAMDRLQQEYEKELEDAHVELDSLREKTHDGSADLAAYLLREEDYRHQIQQSAAQILKFETALHQAQVEISELAVNKANEVNESKAQSLLIGSLEKDLSLLQSQYSQTTEASEAQIRDYCSKLTDRDDTVSRLKTELLDLRQGHDLCQVQLQAKEEQMRNDRTTSDVKAAELSRKLQAALQTADEKANQLRNLEKDSAEAIALKEEELKAIQVQLASSVTISNSVESAELSSRAEKIAETQAIMHELEKEVVQLTTENSRLKAIGLSNVRELEGKITSLKHELAKVLAQHSQESSDRNIASHISAESTLSSERDSLSARMQAAENKCRLLQTEMDATLYEFEAMTRSALIHESERTKSEARTDELAERVILLESQLADERVRALGLSTTDTGATTPSGASPSSQPVSSSEPATTATLRKEFRRLVQDMRSEHAKQTRADFAEIRRLERKLAALQEKGISDD